MLRQWFGFRTPVSRLAYVLGGVLFMGIKFAIDRAIFTHVVHKELTPLAFLSPFFRDRAALLSDAPEGSIWLLLLVSLPFLWLGASMSVRRAFDAGLPPLVGFLFLIPGVHYLLMLALSVLPTRAAPAPPPARDPYRPPPEQTALAPVVPRSGLAALRAIALASLVGLAMFGICVYGFKSYGTALFLATPFVMGTVAALAYSKAKDVSPDYKAPRAFGCAMASLVLVGVALLVSAQEGLGCLAMALFPAALLATLGSLLAVSIDAMGEVQRRGRSALLLLPLAAGVESAAQPAPEYEVVTTIEVDAPPEVVWQHVVRFPDLAPPTEWMFEHGISYPLRARIEGEGVGAIRYCEFSTGDFVEPITRWDAPHVLSFDVKETPPPMRELTPWDQVDAPHLQGFMRSKRGEFRLVALPGGRTRLEGSTWYALEIYPVLYWKGVTDHILHTIHLRVLNHIQALSEAEAAG